MMKHLAEQKTSFNASRTGATKSRELVLADSPFWFPGNLDREIQ